MMSDDIKTDKKTIRNKRTGNCILQSYNFQRSTFSKPETEIQ